jgi:hypothetical protein
MSDAAAAGGLMQPAHTHICNPAHRVSRPRGTGSVGNSVGEGQQPAASAYARAPPLANIHASPTYMRRPPPAAHRAPPYLHTYIHTYIHAYIHTCIHTYMHTYMHAYIHAYIHTYIHAYIHACIHTCIHTHIHAHTHTHKDERASWGC